VIQTGDAHYFHTVVKNQQPTRTQSQRSLHIYYPVKEYREALSNAIYPSLLAGSIALVIVAFLATVIAARVTRPLQRLDRKVAQIAHGNFQPMIQPNRDDEIRDLSISINQMAELLGDYEDEIKRSERLKTLGQLRVPSHISYAMPLPVAASLWICIFVKFQTASRMKRYRLPIVS